MPTSSSQLRDGDSASRLGAGRLRVAILSQPSGSRANRATIRRPRLFFAVSAGTWTRSSITTPRTRGAQRRRVSPGGRIGLRPDRATLVYCQRRGKPSQCAVIAGGVEASLRRLAHYDYWSDTVKRSIVLEARRSGRLRNGRARHCRDRQTPRGGRTFVISAIARLASPWARRNRRQCGNGSTSKNALPIPLREVRDDKHHFAEATRISIRTPIRSTPRRSSVPRPKRCANPPALPLTQEEMDAVYDLPTRAGSPELYRAIRRTSDQGFGPICAAVSAVARSVRSPRTRRIIRSLANRS